MFDMPKKFTVRCGDWTFPSPGACAIMQYPVPETLVAEIFLSKERKEQLCRQGVSADAMVRSHLNDTRFVEVEIVQVQNSPALRLVSLRNEDEPGFAEALDVLLPFDPETLIRSSELWPVIETGCRCRNREVKEEDWAGLLLSEVLLNHYLAGESLPSGVEFRAATAQDLEAVDQWQLNQF